ncbi:MAG: copper chaperone PCu(A)C [Silicimonas sp.]|nr:copper chaperone PCu(A)C [Silicimonas sp.]
MKKLNLRKILRLGRSVAVASALVASLSAAQAGNMTHDHGIKAGDLRIEGAFSRATLPNQPVAGGFMTVSNTGADPDRLIGGTADFAGRVEIHEMAMSGDVMKMRELEAGLEIPAGATVELKPGGYHVMFMDLTRALEEGQEIRVTLEFEKAGKVEVPLQVGARNAKTMKHNH